MIVCVEIEVTARIIVGTGLSEVRSAVAIRRGNVVRIDHCPFHQARVLVGNG